MLYQILEKAMKKADSAQVVIARSEDVPRLQESGYALRIQRI